MGRPAIECRLKRRDDGESVATNVLCHCAAAMRSRRRVTRSTFSPPFPMKEWKAFVRLRTKSSEGDSPTPPLRAVRRLQNQRGYLHTRCHSCFKNHQVVKERLSQYANVLTSPTGHNLPAFSSGYFEVTAGRFRSGETLNVSVFPRSVKGR